MFADKRDAVRVIDNAVAIAKLRFVLHTHPAFRYKPVNVAIVVFNPHRHVVNNAREDLPAAGGVHPPPRQLERLVVIRRVERRLRVPGAGRGFDAMRVIEVNAQLVDGVVGNQRQLVSRVVPLHLMLRQQGKERCGIAPVHQWVEKDAVVEQIVHLCRSHVMRCARAWIGHFRVKNTTH